MAIWCEVHKSWAHVNPHVDGFEARKLSELGRAFNATKLKAMIQAYFESHPPFTSVNNFYQRRNEFIASIEDEEPDPADLLEELESNEMQDLPNEMLSFMEDDDGLYGIH